MPRPSFAVLVTLLVITNGLAVAGATSQDTPFADVLVGDVVIGESEQRFGPMRAVEFDEDLEEVVLEIDLTILGTYGVDSSDAAVHLADEDVRGASVRSAAVRDGVVTLVFAPTDSIIRIDGFRLGGLDTADARAAADLRYDVTFSAGAVDARRFDIVDPDRVTPTLSTQALFSSEGDQQVRIERIRATGGDVTIDLDVTALEAYGVGLGDLEARVDTDEGTVRDTIVDDGVVTVVVSPAAGQALIDVELALAGFETAAISSDERVVARDVTYDASVDGDGDEDVTVEPFDLVWNPATAHITADDPGVGLPIDASGFGPVVAVVALLVVGLLATRRA